MLKSVLQNRENVRTLDTKHGFGTHSGQNLRHQREVGGVMERERSHGGGESGSVEDPKVLLGGQGNRFNAMLGESIGG